MIELAVLNALPAREFGATLGGIFEHSPWVAERAAADRPFSSRLELLDRMRAVVQSATLEEQLALIRAHPKLGARGRSRAMLTAASAKEQRCAGLDACSDEEFAQLLRLNDAYVEKFAFPFILAVRGHDPASIMRTCERRLQNTPPIERQAALREIGMIGGYRLADVVASPAGVEILAMHERLPGAAAASAPAATSLVREWMLAAGLDVWLDAGGRAIGCLHSGGPGAQRLILGLHSDPRGNEVRSDGPSEFLIGIAVAQQLRQRRTHASLDLVVVAHPTDASRALAALRAAGLDEHCWVMVRQGSAGVAASGVPARDAAVLDGSARASEELLMTDSNHSALRRMSEYS